MPKDSLPAPQARSYVAATGAFRSGGDTPRDFLERCIGDIDTFEPTVGAFVATNLEAARAAADEATARWKAGKPLSAVDGMPVGVKDIMETADMPTEQGSPLFVGWKGARDCAAVAALREAGAAIVGKTVTTEFAATVARGTRNPWDPSRTPGGSSSGSAAGVAAGMVTAALGSQVIGSIIRPASYCGVFGYKPSVGGINRGGSFDGFSQSCTGVLAATLAEIWAVTRAITASVGGDAGHPGVRGPMTLPDAKKPARLAMLKTTGWDVAAEEAKAALAGACDALRAAGIEIVDARSHDGVAAAEAAIEDATPLSRRINAWEGHWPLNTYARDMDRDGLSGEMRDRLATAEAMTQSEYRDLTGRRDESRKTYGKLSGDIDACVTLSAPGAAPVGIGSTGNPIFTVPTSFLGIPTVTLPVLRAEGLPLGLQVIGFADRDAELFAAAGAILSICGRG